MNQNLKFENIKKILIPTDGSEYSMRAAELCISVAKLLGAEIIIMNVIDTVALDQIAKVIERNEAENELNKDGEKHIKYISEMAKSEGVKTTSLITKGLPFEQIIHVAKSFEVQLIVIGTLGRRGAEHVLIGSVAERIIEYSNCPVLVIK